MKLDGILYVPIKWNFEKHVLLFKNINSGLYQIKVEDTVWFSVHN